MRKNKLMTKVFAGMMVTALVLQSTPMAPVSAQAAQKKVVIKTQNDIVNISLHFFLKDV